MNKYKWYFFLSFALIFSSVSIYVVQITFFYKPADTFFYLFQDLAFLPFEVLLVTFVIDGLMKKRGKQMLLNKMNMVVGIFFSEMGRQLLKLMASFDSHPEKICDFLSGGGKEWSDKFFKQARLQIKYYDFSLTVDSGSLKDLKNFLISKRDCLLRMLGNPNLLEHESFTDMLWAISHITEELSLHKDLSRLTGHDLHHLENDIKRGYARLVHEWIGYMKHLRDDYPYIFSLSIRDNPFGKGPGHTTTQEEF
ncbi:hypothetical protein ACFLRB_05870 [Acidobacteriota bacterium]